MNRASKKKNFTPWIINLELTNACNLECIFCDHKDLKRKMRIQAISNGLLNKVLREARKLAGKGKIYELGLVGLGEPLLDPKLKEHIRAIARFADIFKRISLNSNLVTMSPEQAEMLAHSKINSYTFSVNADNKHSYRELTGRDSFDKVITNLNLLLHKLKQSDNRPKIDIQILDSKNGNIERLKEKVNLPKGLNMNFFSRKVYSKPAVANNSGLLKIHRPKNTPRYPCWDIYTRVYIDSSGNLYLCTIGNDSYRENSRLCLGNIKNNSILSLFNSRRAREARTVSERGLIPFPECNQCNIWSLTPNNFSWSKKFNKWAVNKKQVRAYGLK